MENMRRDEQGFSLMELVVSIGILMTLSVSGLATGYSEFRVEQSENATEILAKAVFAEALQNERGFDERFTAETAVANWQETADIEDMSLSAGSVPVEDGLTCVWVEAVNDGGFSSVVESSDGCSAPVVEPEPVETDEPVIIGARP